MSYQSSGDENHPPNNSANDTFFKTYEIKQDDKEKKQSSSGEKDFAMYLCYNIIVLIIL